MDQSSRAAIIGSGPNGLAAALTLAHAGFDVTVLEEKSQIGGGTRSGELVYPGLLHDHCSGVHPLAIDTPFSRMAHLNDFGLSWKWPEVQYSHPLEMGEGVAVWRDIDKTSQLLGSDALIWKNVFGSLTRNFSDVLEELLGPLLHVPRHPLKLLQFSSLAGWPTEVVKSIFRTSRAQALFGGVAAHAFRPFNSLASSAIGLLLGTSAHAFGWPVAEGGSMAISNAMAKALEALGGKIVTGVCITSPVDIPDSRIVMFDTTPRAVARIMGDLVPPAISNALMAYKYGPGAFVVHLAIKDGIPWRHSDSRNSGTVHIGGSFREIAHAEAEVNRGRMPQNPFVLVTQPSVADPSRRVGNIHPVSMYAHVPAGYRGDAIPLIFRQIERFAPGFRDCIVGQYIVDTGEVENQNSNNIGGNIVGGANSFKQLVFRPRLTMRPYSVGVPGVYICSSSTPPGAGAHGMCGYNAAIAALLDLELDLR